MKIPTTKPKSAYAHRRDGTWDELIAAMDLFDEAFALTWWWEHAETRIMRGKLPGEWQEHVEEEYERRLEKLR